MYEILEKSTPDGFKIIKILDSIYKDIEFTFSRVAFEEKDDELILNFNFDVFSDPFEIVKTEDEKTNFGQYIGNILTELLKAQVEAGEVIYSGGSNSLESLE